MHNIQKNSSSNVFPHTGEKGFTIIEIMISMLLFLIVTGSIWGLLRVSQQGRSAVNEQTQLAKNVRIALNLMSRDTYNAGYAYPLGNTVVLPNNVISPLLGVPADSDALRDTIPPIISGNNITVNTFNTAGGASTDQVTFLYKDPTFNLVGNVGPPDQRVSQALLIPATGRTTTMGGVVELAPASGGNTACRINDVYLITGDLGSTLGLSTGLNGSTSVQFSNSDPLGLNQTGLDGVLNNIRPTSIYRVNMVTYFVTPDGILTRREFGNIQPTAASVDVPLVYNVEDFQIQYVMDSGAVSDNPSSGPDGVAGNADDSQANLAAIRQIRFTVSVRSIDNNAGGQPYRETMTTTVSTRNLGYEATS